MLSYFRLHYVQFKEVNILWGPDNPSTFQKTCRKVGWNAVSVVDADDWKLQNEEFLKSTNSSYWIIIRKIIVFISSLVYASIKSFFDKLWNIWKLTLALSNRQAAVVKGFNLNKDMIVENSQQKFLISQRMIYGYMTMTPGSSFTNTTYHIRLYLNVKGHMLNMFNFKKNREKQMKELKNLRKEAK